MLHDIRYALRSLQRHRVFALTAILTLGSRHRRQHRDLQRRQRRAAPAAAVPRPRPHPHHLGSSRLHRPRDGIAPRLSRLAQGARVLGDGRLGQRGLHGDGDRRARGGERRAGDAQLLPRPGCADTAGPRLPRRRGARRGEGGGAERRGTGSGRTAAVPMSWAAGSPWAAFRTPSSAPAPAGSRCRSRWISGRRSRPTPPWAVATTSSR